jgi:hypothetical protein
MCVNRTIDMLNGDGKTAVDGFSSPMPNSENQDDGKESGMHRIEKNTCCHKRNNAIDPEMVRPGRVQATE